jgi:hypothetical protein
LSSIPEVAIREFPRKSIEYTGSVLPPLPPPKHGIRVYDNAPKYLIVAKTNGVINVQFSPCQSISGVLISHIAFCGVDIDVM